MSSPALPRKTPCASCPYRRNVASGIWHADEYEKLRRYDGEMLDQVRAGGGATFMCHQGDEHVCSGWLAHRDPSDLIAVRVGISRGDLDPACIDYTTDVSLFASGAEAADHGMSDIERPSAEAVEAISKITRVRSAPGRPDLTT